MNIKDLAGVSIHAGCTELNIRSDRKGCTKWEQVLKEVLEKDFIEQSDRRGVML